MNKTSLAVWTLLTILSSVVFPAMSPAQQPAATPAAFGVTVKAGTLGFGSDLTVGWSPKFNTRLGFNIFWYGLEESETDEEGVTEKIQADLELFTIPMLLDWHPWESDFRLSLGAIINWNNVALSSDTGSVKINEVEYEVQSLDGEVTFNTLSPYLGIGYGNGVDKTGHWHFAFDLGVMFQGAPNVDANAVATDPAQQAALDADLEAERSNIEDDLEMFTVYPVLSFGISYTF